MTKLSKKIKYILAMVLSLLFIGSVTGLAFTTARYVSAPSASGDNDGELEFILADVIVVQTVEELMTAIENGYSNIQIAESMPNPFSVYESEMEVTNDLILDLNGHEIQRNSREPMLKIADGVKLTIIDSSTSQTGSLYNPVGSVLNVAGGTLTTRAGSFESGPRKTEYYSYKDESDYTGGTINSTGISSATVTLKSGSDTADMPVLLPQTSSSLISGNIYFDIQYDSNTYILADTYLYFVMEGSATTAVSTSAADFSYSYYLKEDTTKSPTEYSYDSNVTSATEGYVLVTIYGYNNVKTIASDTNSTLNTSTLDREVSNFAAIKMTSGSLYANGGNYYSYFGEDTAYCVSASGGDLYINDTNGKFEALEEGVCIYCSGSSSDSNISVTAGKFYSYKGSMVSMSGGTMTVTGGTFTKDASAYTATTEGANNAAIDMSGGTLTVTGADDNENAVVINLKGSYMDGIRCEDGSDGTKGSLTITNAQFIYNDGSTVTNTTTYTSNVGIANYGGTVTLSDCLFDTNDASSKGIKSESGTITANGCYFVLSGESSIGIYAEGGTVELGDADEVSTTICMFYIDHVQSCYGIYAAATSATIALNVNAAQFIMGNSYGSETTATPTAYTVSSGTDTFNSAGIYLNATNGTLTLKRAVFMMAGSYSAGVYAEAGEIIQEDADSSGYTNAMLIGVKHSGYSGNGISTNTSFSETQFGKEYFIAMYGVGSGNGEYAASDSFYTIDSSTALGAIQFTGLSATGAKGSYGIFTKGGDITAENVYVLLCSTYGSALYDYGGDVTISNFQADVRSTDSVAVDSTADVYPGNNYSVTADVSGSAISVEGGSVIIYDSTVNTDAYGYLIQTGSLTFGKSSVQNSLTYTYNNYLVSARATAIYVEGGSLYIMADTQLSVTSNIATQSGINDPSGTKLTDYDELDYSSNSTNENYIQPDGIYISGGSLTASGALNMTFSGINNNTSVTDYGYFTVTSYAVRVAGTSSPTVTLTSGTITSSIGGGLEVAATGATVTLGVTNAGNSALVIETTGTGTATSDIWKYTSTDDNGNTKTYAFNSSTASNWKYVLYSQVGNAVKVENGKLTINSGTYYANYSNGIYVNGSSSDVYIYDGIFVGYGSSGSLGPGNPYAIKLFDGNLYVFGGQIGYITTSDGAGADVYANGVFIMGNNAPTATTTTTQWWTGYEYTCNGYFYGGDYNSGTARTITIMTYCNAQIGDPTSSYDLSITGGTYAIGIETTNNDVSYAYASAFAMYSGTVTATTDGIWVGNPLCPIKITGGTITGTTDGIKFAKDYSSTLSISSATINNCSYGIYFVADFSTLNIAGATIEDCTNGVYFSANFTGDVNIGSSTTNTSISGTSYGIRFANTVNGAVNIAGDSSGTYTTTIYGGSNAVLFNNGTAAALTITNSKLYGGYGLYMGAASSANITISGSKLYATGGGTGIEFYSSVFSGDYTFTVDSSNVYGGVGIRALADTSANGTLKICNGSVISDQSGYNYQGLQFNGDMGMALVIDGSGTEVYGAQRAIQAASTVTGSITVTGGAKLYNDVTSTNNTIINIVGALSGSISVTDSTLTGTNYGIYLTAASTGSISLSNSTLTCGTYGIYYVSTNTGALSITNGSTITATSNNALYFTDEMSGALTVTSSTITSNYNAIHFAAAASGAITISGGTITSSDGNGINFNSTSAGGLTIESNSSIRAVYGIYVSGSGIGNAFTISSSTITGTSAGIYFASSFSSSSYTLTINSSTVTGAAGIYFIGATGANGGTIIIENNSTVEGTSTNGIYANYYNIGLTVGTSSGDTSVVKGAQHAMYVNTNLNTSTVLSIYTNTAFVNGNGYYQICATTSDYVNYQGTSTVTCTDGSTFVIAVGGTAGSSYTG